MVTSASPSTEQKKLDPKVAWLFAGAAVVCGIAVSFGLKSASYNVTYGLIDALFVGLAIASTYLTSAKIMGTWGRFTAAAGVFGAFAIWMTHSQMAAGQAGGLVPTPSGPLAFVFKMIAKAGATPFAVMLGVGTFLATSLCGLLGAWGGARLRAGKKLGISIGR